MMPELSKRELAQQILINPAQATKNNAAKRNMCLGMGVIVVAVQTGKDEISKLRDSGDRRAKSSETPAYIGRIGTLRSRSKKPSTPWEASGAMIPGSIQVSMRSLCPCRGEPYAIPPKDRAC